MTNNWHETFSETNTNHKAQNRCCYITVDSAMAASQNEFYFNKLSIHKQTNIMQIMTKNITIFFYLIFYHREIVELNSFVTLSLSYPNTVL
jgi:hypothetical protein